MEPDAVRLMVLLVPVSAMLLVSAKSPVMVADTLPSPLMILSMVVLAVRLKARLALFVSVTPLAVPNVPVLEPFLLGVPQASSVFQPVFAEH